jgi:hypothetical protein
MAPPANTAIGATRRSAPTRLIAKVIGFFCSFRFEDIVFFRCLSRAAAPV